MTQEEIKALMSADICTQKTGATMFREKGNLPMAYYMDGYADGLILALRYMEQMDKKEAAMPASTAANPL